jgi:hypothetical protein
LFFFLKKKNIYACSVNDGSNAHLLRDKFKLKQVLGLQDRNLLVTFGIMMEQKGLEKIITAVQQLATEMPSLLFIAIG